MRRLLWLVGAGAAVALLVYLTSGAPDPDAGRRIYREGILPTGEPLTAVVAGDVEILGTQFSCESCHGRSGMGTSEGEYIVPPIAAQFLFVDSPQPLRPAYTAESLADLLRDGVTPAGRQVNELMPRYRLTNEDIEALNAYLETLSAGNSPGVDDYAIRFATVFSEDVDPAEREAVLAVTRRFFADINSQTRNEGERWDRGYTPESKLPTVYREWVLEEWTLTGPTDGWGEQLEEYYRETPVFALVGGLSSRPFGAVGRFCERNEIPCLYPGADLPEPSPGDFYTMYFSRGLGLEADLVAQDLDARPVGKVVQVYCAEGPAAAAAELSQVLVTRSVAVENLRFDCSMPLPVDDLAAHMGGGPDVAAVLWTDESQLDAGLDALPPGRIYLSSTLLDREAPASLATYSGTVFMAHPFLLPGAPDPAFRRFKLWAARHDLEVTEPRLQAQAFFSCLVLNDAMKHLGRFFVRGFALDMLDHTQGLMAYLPIYPRPTIGPGQRFLSKGGYILPVVDGQIDTADAAWILP